MQQYFLKLYEDHQWGMKLLVKISLKFEKYTFLYKFAIFINKDCSISVIEQIYIYILDSIS